MATEKPRATKATTKSGTTKKTETTAKAKAASAKPAKPKAVRARTTKRAARPIVTPEMIAERAYYIWADGSGGDANAHWLQAERELTAA